MEILWAQRPGRKQPGATCRGQGRDLHPSVLLGRVGASAEGHARPLLCSASRVSWARSLGRREVRVSQEERDRVRVGCGETGSLDRVRSQLTLHAGNGVERLVWQHVMDCIWRGTRGKMSEAVEIAQPTGRGALTVAGKIEEERRDSGVGRWVAVRSS